MSRTRSPLGKYMDGRPGRTQEEWAREFGISRSYVSELASGAVQPSFKLACRIHEVTGGDVPVSAWPSAGDAA